MHPAIYKSILERKKACRESISGHLPKSVAEKAREIAEYSERHAVPVDSYGESSFVRSFELEVAALAGQPDGIFMPTGAMAQQIACRIWSERAGIYRIAMHPTCQMEINEYLGYQKLHGLEGVLVGAANTKTSLADITALQNVSVLVVENPMRALGGVIITQAETERMIGLMRERNIRVHLDGARIFGCLPAMKQSLRDVCSPFDSVYLSLYKGMKGQSGALLLGPSDFIQECRLWRRRQGGEMKEITYMIISARMHMDQMIHSSELWYAKALEVAQLINRFPSMRTVPLIPESNSIQVVFRAPREKLYEANGEIATQHGVWMFDFFIEGPGEGECMCELVIYDSALRLSAEQLSELFSLFHSRITDDR